MKKQVIMLAAVCTSLLVFHAAMSEEKQPQAVPATPCKGTLLPKLCHIQDCTVSTSVDIVDFTNEVYQLSINFSWLAPGHGEQQRLVFVQAKPGEGRKETKRQGGGFRGAFTTLTAGLDVRDQTNSLIVVYDVSFLGSRDETSFSSGSVSFPHTRLWKDWADRQKKDSNNEIQPTK